MSILTGKFLVEKLQEASEISNSIGDRIYPIVIPNGSVYPFIVYEDSGQGGDETKDGPASDNVLCTVTVVAKTYNEAVTLGQAARKAVEGKTACYEDFDVNECVMTTWVKGYDDQLPAFTVSLNFEIKTTNF